MGSTTWDMSQVNAYNARNAPKHRQSAPLEGCEKESELHQQILDECKRRGWIAFHGSMAHQTFRTEGEPDFVILRDGGGVLMVEAKTRKGKLSPAQLAIHAWAARLNHVVHTVRSMEEFLNLLNPTKSDDNATMSEPHHLRD